MKCKEVKVHYMSGQIKHHHFVDEDGYRFGEYRQYFENGQLRYHYFKRKHLSCGEVKVLSITGTLLNHYLMDGEGNEIAVVIHRGRSYTHTEEELIQIAKEHNLPLISDLPKTEAELTLWNLKWPDLPFLPIAPK